MGGLSSCAGGSFSASKSNVKSEYASVAEQSGLKAGDGGFQVNVNGNTELIGGAIASNQHAVDEGKNRFSTGGELSTTDIRNEARYSASSTSVGVGTGSVGQNLAMNGLGAGVGRDSGNASSTTTAGISGIAGDRTIRSTDAQTGIQRIFDKETVQKEIAAQTLITETFSREAPRAVASYAQSKMVDLKADFKASEGDPAKQAEIKAEIDKWDEGGTYRVALHTAAGALGGGLGGAAGAAVSGASANVMNAWQGSLRQSLETAGLGGTAAQGVAQGIATITAAGMGAAVGGAYGAASAATVDANNRQLHPSEKKLAQDLAKKSGGRYTAEQIENAMRNSGNSALGESITAGMLLDPNNPNTVYDSGAVFESTDSGVVQRLPDNGHVNLDLAAFIQTNTGNQSSPYTWSDVQLGRVQPPQVDPNAALKTITPNTKGHITPEAAAGLSPVREAIRSEKDIRNDVADVAANTGRVAGTVAAGSTSAAAIPGPHQPAAGATAVAATGVGFIAGAIEQVARPDTGKGVQDTLLQVAQYQIDNKLPLAAPMTNEIIEAWKKSGSSQSFSTWINGQWSSTLQKLKDER